MTLFQKLSSVLISSGINEPVLYGGGSGHSIFARALLDGLVNMKKEAFSALETFDSHLLPRIAGAVEQDPQFCLITGARHEADDFIFLRSED